MLLTQNIKVQPINEKPIGAPCRLVVYNLFRPCHHSRRRRQFTLFDFASIIKFIPTLTQNRADLQLSFQSYIGLMRIHFRCCYKIKSLTLHAVK